MPALYVTHPETHVHLEQNHLAVDRDDAPAHSPKQRIPLRQINRMVVIGAARIGLPLVRAAMENEIPVTLLSRAGRYQGAFAPYHERDTFLHVRQVDLLRDPARSLRISRSLVLAKLRNSRRLLQRVATTRNLPENASELESREFTRHLRSAEKAETLDALRGAEGAAAAFYFSRLPPRLPPDFAFPGRNRRPPRDPFNALLSLGYSLLMQEVRGLLLAAGLDSGIGVLHGLAYGRPALALDLMEPYRAPVADALAFRLIGLGILKPDDFETHPEHGTILTREALQKYFQEYETRMDRPFRQPGRDEALSMREWIRLDVEAFRKLLQQETDHVFFQMP